MGYVQAADRGGWGKEQKEEVGSWEAFARTSSPDFPMTKFPDDEPVSSQLLVRSLAES